MAYPRPVRLHKVYLWSLQAYLMPLKALDRPLDPSLGHFWTSQRQQPSDDIIMGLFGTYPKGLSKVSQGHFKTSRG